MKNVAFLLAVGFAIPPIAYATDMPSISMAQDAISSIYKQRSNCVKISAFEKTDGQSSEVFGVRYYVMEYAAHLTFIEPCYAQYDVQQKRFGWGPKVSNTAILGKKNNKLFQPGEMVTVAGKIHFEKKESGWHKQ